MTISSDFVFGPSFWTLKLSDFALKIRFMVYLFMFTAELCPTSSRYIPTTLYTEDISGMFIIIIGNTSFWHVVNSSLDAIFRPPSRFILVVN